MGLIACLNTGATYALVSKIRHESISAFGSFDGIYCYFACMAFQRRLGLLSVRRPRTYFYNHYTSHSDAADIGVYFL